MSKKRKDARGAAKAKALRARQWKSLPAETRTWAAELLGLEARRADAARAADCAIISHATAAEWVASAPNSAAAVILYRDTDRAMGDAVAEASLTQAALMAHLDRRPDGFDIWAWRDMMTADGEQHGR